MTKKEQSAIDALGAATEVFDHPELPALATALREALEASGE